MLVEFEKKIADFAEANRLFSSAGRVLLAVSGGADSIALLYAMQALSRASSPSRRGGALLAEKVLNVELLCAHINHQLRAAEADLDEDFVIAQVARLKLPVTVKRLDVRGLARKNKLSIETAARKLRIESVLGIAKANNCSRIATGHQKNDNAETILYRLLRGTGFRGLGGIWPMRAFDDGIKFVRPLLGVTRDEIIEYLRVRNLKWREDHTNADCAYRRNYIRHRLLPTLQQDCTGSIVEQLSQLTQSARKLYGLVCSRAEQAWLKLANSTGDKVVLNLTSFLSESELVRVELVRRSLTTIGSGERDLTQRHYERILQLASGRKIELPGRFTARREYGNLIFAQHKRSFRSEEQIDESVELEVPGQTRFGRYLIEATVFEEERPHVKRRAPAGSALTSAAKYLAPQFIAGFDMNKVKLPLIVRFRQDGDRFWPLGLAGEKKVGKFLTTAKVPWELREKLLIVADSEKIIWIWPIRISEKAKITSGTRKILQLQITNKEVKI